MKAKQIVLCGGEVVSAAGVVRADLKIEGSCIVEIGKELSGEAVVDVTGRHIFPAIIDAHVHFNEPGRTHWEGLATGSRALAAGGGSAFFDMPLNSSPPTLRLAAFELKRKAAEASSVLDFGLWGGLTPLNLEHLDELAEAGVIGYKAFMSESGINDFSRASEATLRAGMKTAAKHDLPVALHAEDEEMIAARPRKGTSWRDYLASRPVEAELSAIRTALELAGEYKCALQIVHVSCPEGVDLILAGRDQGINVTMETCPHYLLLEEKDVGELGAPAKCAPPLRDHQRREGMWERFAAGAFDTLGSDHSPSPPDMKTSQNFFEIWGGIAGCQHGFALTLAEITRRYGNPGLARFAALTSENVAKRFSLPENKGQLKEGADADLTVIDLQSSKKIIPDQLLYRHQLTPYLGREAAVVEQTWLRGKLVFGEGQVRQTGGGQLLKPKPRPV